jgi:NADH:ubiquinone oxidoreductase subunit E
MIDDELFRDLTAEELNRILKQYEKGNHGNTAD